jgi:hypothetical protein
VNFSCILKFKILRRDKNHQLDDGKGQGPIQCATDMDCAIIPFNTHDVMSIKEVDAVGS